jgi:membrane-bound ClpP family serine protease
LVLAAVLAVIFHPYGWIFVGVGITVLGLLGGLVYNFVTKRQLQGRIILKDTLTEAVNTVDFSGMVGKEGTAVTILRPYGEADFNGIRMEVASTGTMIERGAKVRVLETQGTKVVVGLVAGN